MTRPDPNIYPRGAAPNFRFRRASAQDHPHQHALCRVLGYLRFLRHWYETMHWNAAGPSSYGDHLLYERLYDSTDANIDTLAEKITQIWGAGALTSSGNLQCMNDAQLMAESCMQQSPLGETPEVALFLERGLQDLLAVVFEGMELAGLLTMGLNDFLMSLASSHETHLYLLQQRLGGRPAQTSAPSAQLCEHGHVHSEPHVCGVDCDDDEEELAERGQDRFPPRHLMHQHQRHLLREQGPSALGRVSSRRGKRAADDKACRKLKPHFEFLFRATSALLEDPPPRSADDDLAIALRKIVVAFSDLAKIGGNSALSSRLNSLVSRIQVPEVIVSALQPRQALSLVKEQGVPTGPLSEGLMWLGNFVIRLSGQHPVLRDVGRALQSAAPLAEEG